MTKKVNSRKKQAEFTKNKIFETATDLIEKKGYNQVTIREICKKAGVAKGTFYHYFSAKEDLIIETYKRIDQYYDEIIEKGFSCDNTIQQIIEIVAHKAVYVQKCKIDKVKEVYKAQMEVGNNFFTSKDRSSYKILYNIIQKAQANNEFIKTKTAAEITTFIWIIVRGIIYDWCVNNGSYDLETFLKKYIKDILQTFLK
ncbi:TetR/AcrR family transcriptional regulator [Halanaerobium praevalens]|uniref:Transcriptional regulator, TetR family n=1 Tax=Halanaerobium praevalens (strain ATCC 33744 / DSM 2228 / GSL) TaxID=572479 RepID=E3DRV3_HALPG|nr:TetR/AcrR family transcriptional regulator [Halanaerobium praevalens]ADO78167.1 transcriptional regulator, TetR family [Halanaerobium praevalens DSM 2228]